MGMESRKAIRKLWKVGGRKEEAEEKRVRGRRGREGCLTKLSLNSSALAMASSIASSATRRATVSVSAILCPDNTTQRRINACIHVYRVPLTFPHLWMVIVIHCFAPEWTTLHREKYWATYTLYLQYRLETRATKLPVHSFCANVNANGDLVLCCYWVSKASETFIKSISTLHRET